jgi:PAS domain S-box-containing protein
MAALAPVSALDAVRQELARSELRYRSLFQAAQDCLLVIAPDGAIIDINENGCRSLGYTLEELRGGTFARILDETKLRRMLPRPGSIPVERRTVRAEQELRGKDGRRRAVEFTAGGLPDGNVLVIVRDVTERRRSEELLNQIARRVAPQTGRDLFLAVTQFLCAELPADMAFVGELASDCPGRVRTVAFRLDGDAAPGFEYPLAGSPAVEAFERRGSVVHPEKVAEAFPQDPHLARLQAQGYVGTALYAANGERLGIVAALTRQPLKRPQFCVSLLEVLAARVASEIERSRAENVLQVLNASLEQRVRQRTVELEAANREMESFSYSVSHDLRAPVRAVMRFSDQVRRRCGAMLPPEGLHLLSRVEENARRMTRLIDHLMEFSRTGRAALNIVPVDMRSLAAQVADECAASCLAGAELRIGALPPARGDAALLRQVWTNLIDNAFKFSAKTAQPRIEIRGEQLDGLVRYSVADNGAGFDMEYAGKLFGVFQRLHTQHEFDGTGVGLAIVQRIVEKHGGQVSGEGRPGAGATFRFTLPAERATIEGWRPGSPLSTCEA